MYITAPRFLKWPLLVLSTIFTVSCGNDNSAPDGGDVLINPDDLTLTWLATAGCVTSFPPPVTDWLIEDFRISVHDSNGSPLPGMAITATLAFTGGTSSYAAAWLFDDLDGNGTVFAAGSTPASPIWQTNELVSTLGDPIGYETETNGQGYKDLIVVFNMACGWSGSLWVKSGAVSEKADIDLTVI